MSPARYRHLAHAGIPAVASGRTRNAGTWLGGVHGTLLVPETEEPTRVYVAAFDSPIPQGLPIACVVVDSGGTYELDSVPMGAWYIRAAAVAVADIDPRPWLRRPLAVNAAAPVKVLAGDTVRADVELHLTRSTDLPILLALPELDSWRPPKLCSPKVG